MSADVPGHVPGLPNWRLGIAKHDDSQSISFFWFGGMEGNASCTVAPQGAVCGTPERLAKPFGQKCRLTYPLKPPYAGGPGHIPLREVDDWTYLGRSWQLAYPPRGYGVHVVETTFHETRRVPALPHHVCNRVFQRFSRLGCCYFLIVYCIFVSSFPYSPYCNLSQGYQLLVLP